MINSIQIHFANIITKINGKTKVILTDCIPETTALFSYEKMRFVLPLSKCLN